MMNAISSPPASSTKPADPSTGNSSAKPEEGSEFLDMILKEVSAMPGGNAVQTVLQQMQEDAEEDGTGLVMQMLAELLGTNPGMEELLQQLTQQNPELLQELVQMAKSQGAYPAQSALLERFMATAETTAETATTPTASFPAAQQNALLQQSETTTAYTSYRASPTAPVSGEGMDNISVEVLSPGNTSGKETDSSSADMLGGQAKFRDAILEAKKLLKTNGTQNNASSFHILDIDKLQSHVDNARLDPSKGMQEELPLPHPQEVMDQVQSGISQNLATGKNEFVVKLKPDGLGEIVVKFTEIDNKMTLSIMTSNTQVAKLLGDELGVLRSSLKPYNVEVHEIVSQTASSNSTLGAESNQQFAQTFSGQQGQAFSHQQLPRYYYQHGEAEAEAGAFPPDMLERIQVTGLDTYI